MQDIVEVEIQSYEEAKLIHTESQAEVYTEENFLAE